MSKRLRASKRDTQITKSYVAYFQNRYDSSSNRISKREWHRRFMTPSLERAKARAEAIASEWAANNNALVAVSLWAIDSSGRSRGYHAASRWTDGSWHDEVIES